MKVTYGNRHFARKIELRRKVEKVEDQIIKKILGRISGKVKFVYPQGEEKRQGILKDRGVECANPKEEGVPYWSVVDLIKFDERDGG